MQWGWISRNSLTHTQGALWLTRRVRSSILLLVGLACGCSACRQPSDEDAPSAHPGAADQPPTVRVLTGADVLVSLAFEPLRGQRVGLIANPTARVGDRHLIDVLGETPEVDLVALFGPEHGLRGRQSAGERISSGVDELTGLPVHSLYGDSRAPSPESLAQLDALVFDIQDVGARYYTYISTMGLAMQAAAVAGVRFVVLDRPNPLGGERVEGFVLEPEHRSFVGMYAIPIVHGLTVGELARMAVGERWLEGIEDLRLEVVEMKGWKRSMTWPATGLHWIAPSPNLPDFETALVYAGTCLFEATIWSEGRGTETPFRLLGGPGISSRKLSERLQAQELAGVHFEEAEFAPRSIPGRAENPKLEGQELAGVRLTVTDAATYEPLRVALELLRAFRDDESSTAPFNEKVMDRLAGTSRLREALESDASADQIADLWREEVEAFRVLRRPYLLYD